MVAHFFVYGYLTLASKIRIGFLYYYLHIPLTPMTSVFKLLTKRLKVNNEING